jgi:hypothetical protein
MGKFRRLGERDIRGDALHRRLTWFDKDSPQTLVEEVMKMDTAIQKVEEKMAYVSNDKEALHACQMRESLEEIIALLKSGKSPEEILREYMDKANTEGR